MGTRTYAEKVPFKIIVWSGEEGDPTGNDFLDHYQHWCETFDERRIEAFRYDGWTAVWQRGVFDEYGKLTPFVFSKDGKKVYELNESENAGFGRMVQTFFADDKKTLEDFCEDMNFPAKKIKKDQIVQQTI